VAFICLSPELKALTLMADKWGLWRKQRKPIKN